MNGDEALYFLHHRFRVATGGRPAQNATEALTTNGDKLVGGRAPDATEEATFRSVVDLLCLLGALPEGHVTKRDVTTSYSYAHAKRCGQLPPPPVDLTPPPAPPSPSGSPFGATSSGPTLPPG